MKIELTGEERHIIKQSLKYSKLKIESIPIGPEGYPDSEFKKSQVLSIELLQEKLPQQSADK